MYANNIYTYPNIGVAPYPSFMWQENLEGVARFVTRALEGYLTLPGAVRP
jgi:hypothetical protein